jgi:transposase-like protein
MNQTTATSTLALLAGATGYDPIEDRLRQNIRATIEALFEEELAAFIGRCRYGRGGGSKKGYRHGHRERQLVGTFGTQTVSVPRARIEDEDGRITEWRSKALPRYQRLTKKAEALIASVYLAGTKHATGQASALRPVPGSGEQGRGLPGLAEGEGRLGRLVRPKPGR